MASLAGRAASALILLSLVSPVRPAAAQATYPATGAMALDPQARVGQGVYWLSSTLSLKCISAAGAALGQATCSGDEARRLLVLPLGVDGAYVIKSVKAGKCLAVPLDAPTSATVRLSNCNHGRTQRWQLSRLGTTSTVQLRSLENKRCLSVGSATAKPATAATCGFDKRSLWDLQRLYTGPKLFSWSKTLDAGVGRAIDRTTDGSYVLLINAAGAKWPTLVKITPHGAVIWKRSCSAEGTKVHETLQPLSASAESAVGHGVQQTADGGYIVTSRATVKVCAAGTCTTQELTHLLKTDAGGSKQWDTLLRGTAGMTRQTRDGGYVLVGAGLDGAAGSQDTCSFVRLDKAANITWQRGLGPSASRICSRIVETADGALVAAGFDKSNKDLDLVVLRLEASGQPVWIKTYGTSQDELMYDLLLTAGGRFLVYGGRGVVGGAGGNALLLEVDRRGNQVRERVLSQTLASAQERYVRQLAAGGYALLDTAYSGPSTVTRLDDRLRAIWSGTVALGTTSVNEVIEVADDRLVTVGSSRDSSSQLRVHVGELSL